MAQPGPELPLENTGKIPAATQLWTVAWYHGSEVAPPPQELFTMCGRRSGSGLLPSRSVGATIHCPDDSSADWEQLLDSHPLAAIQVAPGATPIWFSPPSLPRMVPMVWVPCPLLSQGTPGEQIDDGSHQW